MLSGRELLPQARTVLVAGRTGKDLVDLPGTKRMVEAGAGQV